MRNKLWADRRSGALGCYAGSAVLAVLQEAERDKVEHEKGTVFGTPKKLFVCRFCQTNIHNYLQKGIAHFCNLSMDQHQEVTEKDEQKRDVYYVFITVSGNVADYWVVASKVIGEILPSLKAKPDGTTRFLRITTKNDKYYIGERNVTSSHRQLKLPRKDIEKVCKQAQRGNPTSVVRRRNDGKFDVKFGRKTVVMQPV